MAEGGVADVVPEGDGFDEVLVQPEGATDRAGDLGHFERVGEASTVMVTERVDKDLGLVLQAAERLRV